MVKFCMDQFWHEFEIESAKVDEKISELQASTLHICNVILANPERYKAKVISDVLDTKKQLTGVGTTGHEKAQNAFNGL